MARSVDDAAAAVQALLSVEHLPTLDEQWGSLFRAAVEEFLQLIDPNITLCWADCAERGSVSPDLAALLVPLLNQSMSEMVTASHRVPWRPPEPVPDGLRLAIRTVGINPGSPGPECYDFPNARPDPLSKFVGLVSSVRTLMGFEGGVWYEVARSVPQ